MIDNKAFELSEKDLVKAYKSLIYDIKALFEFQKTMSEIGLENLILSGPNNCPDVMVAKEQCRYFPKTIKSETGEVTTHLIASKR